VRDENLPPSVSFGSKGTVSHSRLYGLLADVTMIIRVGSDSH
jgi:hypothetical protein